MNPAVPPSHPCCPRAVIDLLASYLLADRRPGWPGADGLTVEDAVAGAYPAAAVAGRVPPPAELSLRHPDLADALATFFRRTDAHALAS